MQILESKDTCCGCSACVCICPVTAIHMKYDEQGFYYPVLDFKKCISCGLCADVCFYKNGKGSIDNNSKLNKIQAFAIKNKNESIRFQSRSGGAFTAISDIILEDGGVVFGVGYDNKFNVVHQRAIQDEMRDTFRGSKYVQSDIGKIFLQVKKDLENEKSVLFTGTSCQIAGLKSFLLKEYRNLMTIDIVCHGVLSPMIYQEYRNFISKKYHGELEKFDFRDKMFGWGNHIETFVINGKKHADTVYTKLYYSHACMRPSCYSCPFANLVHPADITIADCWGIEKQMPELYDDKGMSLVLINTKKGIEYFNRGKKNMEIWPINIKDYMQPQFLHPTIKPHVYEEFWQDYKNYGFEYILVKYAEYDWKSRLKKWKYFKFYSCKKKLKYIAFIRKIYIFCRHLYKIVSSN